MQVLTMSQRIYDEYIRTVKGNENTTLEQAQLKMTRNAQLAIASPRKDPRGDSTHYKYGGLHFIVNNVGEIVWLRNNAGYHYGWTKDEKRYAELSRELGIEDAVPSVTPTRLGFFSGILRKIRNK